MLIIGLTSAKYFQSAAARADGLIIPHLLKALFVSGKQIDHYYFKNYSNQNMNLINRIFRRNMVDCPRCLGKGMVDLEDIKRLKKELFWAPGKCAYCNGIGKVPPDRPEKVRTDFEYLTTDLPSWERHKVINGDEDALKRANEFKDLIQNIIEEIEHLYYIENKEPGEIAEHIFHKQSRYVFSQSEKQELIDYIEKVIKSKLKH